MMSVLYSMPQFRNPRTCTNYLPSILSASQMEVTTAYSEKLQESLQTQIPMAISGELFVVFFFTFNQMWHVYAVLSNTHQQAGGFCSSCM